MKKLYAKPELVFYGNVEDITRADATSTDEDGIYYSGTQVGTSQGSQDACISTDLVDCD